MKNILEQFYSNVDNEDTVMSILEKCTYAYYNEEALIDDQAFDEMYDKAKLRYPDNVYFKSVGSSPYGKKIMHKYPMISMQKSKTIEDVEKWLNKISDKKLKLIIEPKIDGISACIVYKKGKLDYIATRGNGLIGQNISHIADYIDDIPKTLKTDSEDWFEVRGELYLPKNTELPNPDNKPLRNLCAGIVNRKSDLDDLRFIRFIAYQLRTDPEIVKNEIEVTDILDQAMPHIVEYNIVDNIKEIEKFYNNYLENIRNKWMYETDGLIITVNDYSERKVINSRWVIDHHNHFDMALKPPSVSKTTTLLGIKWYVKKSGNVVPVGILSPINIGGSIIQNVTLNNYENVERLKLHKNDEVLISKANDVIPFFEKNLTVNESTSPDLIPDKCPSCKTDLSKISVHIVCENPNCTEVRIQRIVRWTRDLDGISEAIIRSLWDNNLIRNIANLYNLKTSDIECLDGFGEKSAAAIISILDKSRDITIVDLLSKLNIHLVGRRAIKKLGIKSIKEFLDFNDSSYKIGQNILEWKSIKDNISLLNDIEKALNIKEPVSTETKGKVCITGSGPKGRKELISDLETMGYEFSSGVTKETDILLCNDINGTSSKLKKARQLGIKLISYDEFFK